MLSSCQVFSIYLLRSVHTGRQVAATCRGNTLQRKIASCVLENFCENLCRCNRICRRHKSHSPLWFDFLQLVAATKFCCGDKDFHKNSSVHTKRFVAATCRLTLLLQLVAWPVHIEWSVAATCCSNLSPSVYRPLEYTYLFHRFLRSYIQTLAISWTSVRGCTEGTSV